jgi:hypothetical protein
MSEFVTPRDEDFTTPRDTAFHSARGDDPRDAAFHSARDGGAEHKGADTFTTPRDAADTFTTPRDVAESKQADDYDEGAKGEWENKEGGEGYSEGGGYGEEQEQDYTSMGYYEGEDYNNGNEGEEAAPYDEADQIFSLARHNRLDEVEALLNSGIPVDILDVYGNTILHIACQNGLKKMAKIALRRGGNINALNVSKVLIRTVVSTPVHFFASCKYKGNTPLHFCHQYGFGDTLGMCLVPPCFISDHQLCILHSC